MAQKTARILTSIIQIWKCLTDSVFLFLLDGKETETETETISKNLQKVFWIRNYLSCMYCMLLNELLTCLFCGLLNDEWHLFYRHLCNHTPHTWMAWCPHDWTCVPGKKTTFRKLQTTNWGKPSYFGLFYCNWPWVRTSACSDSCTGGTWRARGHCPHESPHGSANLLEWGSVSHRSSSCAVSGAVWGIYNTDWKNLRDRRS